MLDRLLVSPDIALLPRYRAGESIRGAVKLSSNENPLGPSKKAIAAARAALGSAHIYPDGEARRLKTLLAERWKVDPGQIVAGNGSNEIIELLVRTFLIPSDEAVGAQPTFSLYRLMATAAHARYVAVPLKEGRHDLPEMARRVTERTRLLFICNPNNPTGTIVTDQEVGALLDRLPPHVLVVFDEAYADFVSNRSFPRTVEAVRRGLPVIMLRTFSKIYGLAALRIGYGVTTPQIASLLDRVRQPFNLGGVAQAAAIAALSDLKHHNRSRALAIVGRRRLSAALLRLGFSVYPSEANFVYFDTGRDGEKVYRALLDEGIVVRHIEGSHLRVTVGLDRQNRRFLAAIKKIVARRKG